MSVPSNFRRALILAAIFPSVAIGLVNGCYAETLLRQGAGWYWLADITQFVLIPGMAFLALWRLGGFRQQDFGLPNEPLAKSLDGYVGWVLLTTLVYFVSYLPIVALVRAWFAPPEASSAYITALPSPGMLRIIAVFYLCVSAAIVEEMVFRSLPWLYFSRTFARPVLPYTLTTAILFGAIHWESGAPNLIAAGTLGVAAALLYTRIRNVQPFMWAHFFVNAWAFPWQ